MTTAVSIQILDYPGAQKSASLGMSDILEYANAHAAAVGGCLFSVRVVEQPVGPTDVLVMPPSTVL